MKRIIILIISIIFILLSCTTVEEKPETYEEMSARIRAETEAKREVEKQKREEFIQPLSDQRFNGTFYRGSDGFEYKWMFDGTNYAFYYNGYDSYVNSSWYSHEIRIEDGVLYQADWPISGYRKESEIVRWREVGKYSFTDNGNLVITYDSKMRDGRTYTFTDTFLRDRSKD